MKLICKFCGNEITTKLGLEYDDKLKEFLVCTNCFVMYMEKYHHFPKWYDDYIDKNDPHWYGDQNDH